MASSPDYSGQNQAAVMGAQDAREYMDWARQEYARQRPQMDESRDLTLQNQRSAQALMDGTVRPGMQALVTDATTFDSAANRGAAANAAQADVQTQFGQARQGTLAALARRGISGSAAGEMLGSQDVALASARAGAAGQASRAIQEQGFNRRASALSLAAGGTGSAGVGANPGMVGQAASNLTAAQSQLAGTLGQINGAAQQNANSTNGAVAGLATTALVAY